MHLAVSLLSKEGVCGVGDRLGPKDTQGYGYEGRFCPKFKNACGSSYVVSIKLYAETKPIIPYVFDGLPQDTCTHAPNAVFDYRSQCYRI